MPYPAFSIPYLFRLAYVLVTSELIYYPNRGNTLNVLPNQQTITTIPKIITMVGIILPPQTVNALSGNFSLDLRARIEGTITAHIVAHNPAPPIP